MRRIIRKLGLVIVDVFIINISFLIAFILKYDGEVVYIITTYLKTIIWVSIIATIIKLMCFIIFKLYNSLWSYAGIYEAMRLITALIISNAIVVSLVTILSISIPLSIFIMTFFIETLFMGGTRFLYRVLRRIKQRAFSYTEPENRLMIIGGGEAGSIIVKELEQSPFSDSKAIAIIDDDENKKNMKLHGVPIVGNRYDIVRVAKEMNIDEIIIAIPSAPKKEINAIYSECSKTDCKVRILPS
ncbi:MAG TPA: polysaccharide biosynthesis protein, partial [Clostridiaceae bacterium]|nr:polysaccharide biosynthesis protein [Clostridiaceae bacterium]